jgi:hypothetical protein
MLKRLFFGVVVAALLSTVLGLVDVSASSASSLPSGQRMYGSTSFDPVSGHFVGGGGTIEPAYDDATGTLVYIQTPNGPPVHPANHIDPATGMPKNVAPIYLPVYPAGSGIDSASLNCAHQPADNCADHGPEVAGAAMSIVPGVYGGGVLGHDHLLGIASTDGDFNVLWEPVLVLFTNASAATEHITTLAQIRAAEAAGNAMEVPLPPLTFHCSAVSAAAYGRATPSPTVVGP